VPVKDLAAAEEWIRRHVRPAAPIEVFREKPWATVLRVPLAAGTAWFKECAPVQAFEPSLTAGLSSRWPGRVAEVLAHDPDHAWLLMADAGELASSTADPLQSWIEVLPRYAELQRGEAAGVDQHLLAGVPDLRLSTWPQRYENLAARDLPLSDSEVRRLRRHGTGYAGLCAQLAAAGVPDSIQHDDLHPGSLYASQDQLRILDWGDASVSHPFASLVVPFRFLEEFSRIPPGDPVYSRLRDAYLEPWGRGWTETFDAVLRVGAFAHAFARSRQRDALPARHLPAFDLEFAVVLRRALARAG
jgi:hypothetical protein